MLVGVKESTVQELDICSLAYYSAKFCGKEVSIVNHCVDPGNSSAEEMIKNVYPLLKRCWVRDNLSKVNLEKLELNLQNSFQMRYINLKI